MLEVLGLYLSIIASGMIKFVLPMTLGKAAGLPMPVTMLLTVISMMITVSIITYGGQPVRDWLVRRFARNRKLFTKRNRRFVKVWRRWGVSGVAFLTPVLLSPPIGTMLVVAAGAKRNQILIYMLVSAVFWSVTQTFFWYVAVDWLQSLNWDWLPF